MSEIVVLAILWVATVVYAWVAARDRGRKDIASGKYRCMTCNDGYGGCRWFFEKWKP